VYYDELEGVSVGDLAVRIEKREYIGFVDVNDLAVLLLQVRGGAGCVSPPLTPTRAARRACARTSWGASSAACSGSFTWTHLRRVRPPAAGCAPYPIEAATCDTLIDAVLQVTSTAINLSSTNPFKVCMRMCVYAHVCVCLCVCVWCLRLFLCIRIVCTRGCVEVCTCLCPLCAHAGVFVSICLLLRAYDASVCGAHARVRR
jgi:hypothetical protein